ncbi:MULTISPECIES: hypothetical protein [unclassified Prochlorococcus]|uniref:hypothetical protein n=1 Tax=unclassified Prochlorococcus TaxID=2627481 RepID=UPI000533AF0F|nr:MULTISPECIES: hypothetical protein [unclassified Prochlorococcus]KGG16179.1 hypothetical protein EV07_1345 [Prochlorococcus sp. MIT 0603]KGG18086.1 hypothetical protein EV06_0215 [Prochlorococcus sp. MIT 0602]
MAFYSYYLALAQVWKPSEGFIHWLLIFGAFLLAGVALSIFTFYEDCYWGDKDYRKFLKEGKKSSAKG